MGSTLRHSSAIILSLFFLAGGTAVAIWLGDWVYVTRSGALIVIAAVLLEAMPVLLVTKGDDLPMWTNQDDHRAIQLSIILICFGTFVQGFGDLVARGLFGALPH